MNIFGGMKILWMFLGHHKIGLALGLFICILLSFLKLNVHKGDIFWIAKISNIFWGTPYIPDTFGLVNSSCWFQAYV